jgi:hypothetical protein
MEQTNHNQFNDFNKTIVLPPFCPKMPTSSLTMGYLPFKFFWAG